MNNAQGVPQRLRGSECNACHKEKKLQEAAKLTLSSLFLSCQMTEENSLTPFLMNRCHGIARLPKFSLLFSRWHP
jgi:hypothetical protein